MTVVEDFGPCVPIMIGLPDDGHQKRRVVVEEAVIRCALVQSVCPGTNVVVVEETVSWYKAVVRGLRCLPSIIEVPNTLRDLVLGLPGLVRGSCHFRGNLAYINHRLN